LSVRSYYGPIRDYGILLHSPFSHFLLSLQTQIASPAQRTQKSSALVVNTSGEETMMNKWKLATVAALIAAGIASPGIAHTHHASNPALHRSAGPRTGLRAFDAVPGGYGNSYGPAATGGGSAGYNFGVEHDY
jgi:hypothetical protein